MDTLMNIFYSAVKFALSAFVALALVYATLCWGIFTAEFVYLKVLPFGNGIAVFATIASIVVSTAALIGAIDGWLK